MSYYCFCIPRRPCRNCGHIHRRKCTELVQTNFNLTCSICKSGCHLKESRRYQQLQYDLIWTKSVTKQEPIYESKYVPHKVQKCRQEYVGEEQDVIKYRTETQTKMVEEECIVPVKRTRNITKYRHEYETYYENVPCDETFTESYTISDYYGPGKNYYGTRVGHRPGHRRQSRSKVIEIPYTTTEEYTEQVKKKQMVEKIVEVQVPYTVKERVMQNVYYEDTEYKSERILTGYKSVTGAEKMVIPEKVSKYVLASCIVCRCGTCWPNMRQCKCE